MVEPASTRLGGPETLIGERYARMLDAIRP
jgi:hypothetical protein